MLGEDPRFGSIPDRMQNSAALVAELGPLFQSKTLEQWGPIFDREQVWFAPVQTLAELTHDKVAEAAGAFVEMESPDGLARQVATPGIFFGTPIEPGAWAPELGYDWDRIIALKEAGAIP